MSKTTSCVSYYRSVLLAGAGMLAMTVGMVPASAAENDVADAAYLNGGIETVIVTARHRAEKAQDVPISLSVVNSDVLEANGITNSLNLNQVFPSLQVISTNPRNTTILVRGLGSNVAITNDGLEAGVGVYVDGVLYSRPAASTFDQSEIASIEELRGPQGTLIGKNAIAGALNHQLNCVGRDVGNFGVAAAQH